MLGVLFITQFCVEHNFHKLQEAYLNKKKKRKFRCLMLHQTDCHLAHYCSLLIATPRVFQM